MLHFPVLAQSDAARPYVVPAHVGLRCRWRSIDHDRRIMAGRCFIYTIIIMYVCRCWQTAGRKSWSIVSLDVSNCWYRLTIHPVTSSPLRKTHTNYREDRPSRMCILNEPAIPVTMQSRLNRQRPVGAVTTTVMLSGDRLSQNSDKENAKTATMRVYT